MKIIRAVADAVVWLAYVIIFGFGFFWFLRELGELL